MPSQRSTTLTEEPNEYPDLALQNGHDDNPAAIAKYDDTCDPDCRAGLKGLLNLA